MFEKRAVTSESPPVPREVEDRSNLVRHVTDPKQKYLLHNAEGFLFEPLPVGTRIIYPPPPLTPLADPEAAINHALDHPEESDPLDAQLKPGMRVTILLDDISLPLPAMRTPDVRERVLKAVLERLSRAGVDDIHLIMAIGLHRRMTPAEIRRAVGKDVFDRFFPDRLYNHDAEDKENLVHLGNTEKGEDVEISKRVMDSDLNLYININLVAMDGGHKSIHTGVSSYRSVRHHHNVNSLMNSLSYMDPPKSELHHSVNRMGKIFDEACNTFHIETTLNSDTFPKMLGFLQKYEPTYSPWDAFNLHLNAQSLNCMPSALRRKIFFNMFAPYGMTGVNAGKTDPVHEKTLAAVHRQQLVPVKGQSDVLLFGLPYIGPYNVNSIMNPILVMCMSLGYLFNMYRGRPLVRKNGVMILTHRLEYKFHKVHHPSYIDFFEQVLTETLDPSEMERKFEESFAYNDRYIDLYRNSYAYHGVHPFYMWYWGSYALKYLSKVIAVRPSSKEAAGRMGFETAGSLPEAFEMASDAVGKDPSITYYHCPPIFLCDVA